MTTSPGTRLGASCCSTWARNIRHPVTARQARRDIQPKLDPGRLIFIDESGVATVLGLFYASQLNRQGATMPPCRRPAMKVDVIQCPCGTLPIARSPRGERA
jgi:hypothetical protein